jgi:hypothetical protein
MEKPSRFSILLVLLTALASCNSWNGNPSQGTQTGVQIAVAIQKPQKDALTNIREVEVRASVTGASKIDKVELTYQGGASGVITLRLALREIHLEGYSLRGCLHQGERRGAFHLR